MLSEHENVQCAFCGESTSLLEIDVENDQLTLQVAEGWCFSVVIVNRKARVSFYCPNCAPSEVEAFANAMRLQVDTGGAA